MQSMPSNARKANRQGQGGGRPSLDRLEALQQLGLERTSSACSDCGAVFERVFPRQHVCKGCRSQSWEQWLQQRQKGGMRVF